ELIESGLMYEDMASEMFRQWDRDGDGTLDKYEFQGRVAGKAVAGRWAKGHRCDGVE
ncbi:unnamed protein product, partial [Prorocentrum cordatum]